MWNLEALLKFGEIDRCKGVFSNVTLYREDRHIQTVQFYVKATYAGNNEDNGYDRKTAETVAKLVSELESVGYQLDDILQYKLDDGRECLFFTGNN